MVRRARAAGLRTAAFVSAPNFATGESNISQRFDLFSSVDEYFERRAEDVNAHVIPWLNENIDQDFFIWAHYYDAHSDYVSEPSFEKRFSRARSSSNSEP